MRGKSKPAIPHAPLRVTKTLRGKTSPGVSGKKETNPANRPLDKLFHPRDHHTPKEPSYADNYKKVDEFNHGERNQ